MMDLKLTLGRKILNGALDAGFRYLIVQGQLHGMQDCLYPQNTWSIHRVQYILDLPEFDNDQGHGYRTFFHRTTSSRANRWFFCPLMRTGPAP